MKKAVLFFILFAFTITTAFPQSEEKSKESKDLEFSPIPYISYNRTTEFEFGVLPMVMYSVNKKDTISPKSISGAMYVYTTNKSQFGFQFNKLYLNEDRYRITLAVGVADYNAQVFIDGIFIPSKFYDFNTYAQFFMLKLERRVWRNIFLGTGFAYINAENSLEIGGPVFKSERSGLSFFASNDNRDDVYFPTAGSLFESRVILYPELLGNKQISQTILLSYNQYKTLRNERDILAFRLSTDFSLGEVSFDQQVVVGGREIRGYSEGRYRGEQVANFQLEYRYNPWDKLGFVGFGSISKLWGSNIESHNEYWYPALGAGFRYMAFKENKMRVGLDAAVGREDWGIYFKIGEAF